MSTDRQSSDNHGGFGFALGQSTWQTLAPGLREKRYEVRRRRFRILEFSQEFHEPEWCLKGHAGYVLEGQLIVNVDGEEVTYTQGDVIDLPPGVRHKHQATPETATVFLIEDVTQSMS